MRQKHILQLARFYTPHQGGVETHLTEMNRLLIAEGYKVSVISLQYDKDLPLHETIDAVEVYRLPFVSDRKKSQLWKAIGNHKALLQSADVIQVHDIFWWLLPQIVSFKHKVYMTFHGWEGQYPVALSAKLQRYVANKLSRGSMHVGAWIQEFYWDTPTVVTYGGVRLHEGAKLHSLQPQCVFLGRLEKENDIEKYLELADELKKRDSRFRITWVGDGKYRRQCEAYGEVTGMVGEPHLYVQRASFVFANSYLSILEAQAEAKVVISLYSHPLKQRYLETFPGYSLLLCETDPSLLAEKMMGLLADKEMYKSLASDNFEFAKTMSWQKVVEAYKKIWHFN